MPWLNFEQGKTPGELYDGRVGGGSIPSGLLRRQDPFAEVIAAIAPAIKEYVQRKKSDQIANRLMNMQQPPRAEAVDPRLQGAPPTMPFTGGAEEASVLQMFQEQQRKEEDRALNREYKRSLMEKQGRNRVPVEINGETYEVTPNEALRHFDRTRKSQPSGDSKEKLDADLVKAYGFTSESLEPILRGEVEAVPRMDDKGVEVGRTVQFQTKDGVPITTEKANILPFVNRAMALFKGAQNGAVPTTKQSEERLNPNLSPRDQEAFEWATANPDDPRSAAILRKLGIQ